LRSSNGALDCLGAHQQAFPFGRSMVEPLLFGDALRLYLETSETPETTETPGGGKVPCTPESIQPELHEALNLGCPSCEVFCDPDPDGCIAMKCSSCDVAFCWLCFQPCGRDAHPHCRTVHGGYFPPRTVVNQWHRRLRWRQVAGVLQRAFGKRTAAAAAAAGGAGGGTPSTEGLSKSAKRRLKRKEKARLVKLGQQPVASEAAQTDEEAEAPKLAVVIASKRKEALREEALRLCARNLADSEIRLWPFPTAEPSVGGMLEAVPHVQAAQFGRIDELRALLDNTPEVIDHANDRGMTALMAAAHGGHAAVVTMLLERGADVTCRDDRGVSALDYAIRENKQEVARALLDCGAKVDVLKKGLNIESATMLAKIGAEKGIMLSGMTRDQTEANFSDERLEDADTILIVSDLKLMAGLTSVDLRFNSIGDDGAKAIAEALKVNAVLTNLRLDLNNIGAEGAIAIAEALKVNAVLTTLNLWYNSIGVEGAKAIAEALKVNAVMKNLSVAHNSNIVGEAAQQLAAAALGSLSLKVLSGVPIKELREDKLTELNLSSNSLGSTEGIVLAELIKFSAVLTNLILVNNSIGAEGAIAIAEALKVNAVLTELSLWDNQIGPEGAIAIAEALKVNAVMTTLNLGGNSIGDEGAKAIAEALKVTAVVTTLAIGMNDIGDEGAKAIAEALKVTAVLTTLDLGGNNIGDEGAIAIAEALKVNAVVTTLAIGGNSIGDEGAKAIAEALKVNAVLTSVDLQANSMFGDDGAKAIAEALKVNAVLTTLNLGRNYLYNSIGDEGAIAIAEALKVNAVLTTLSLNGNNIGVDGAKAIAEVLKVNAVLTELDISANDMMGDAGEKAVLDAVKGRSGFVKLEL